MSKKDPFDIMRQNPDLSFGEANKIANAGNIVRVIIVIIVIIVFICLCCFIAPLLMPMPWIELLK